jgi:hypothetical protein
MSCFDVHRTNCSSANVEDFLKKMGKKETIKNRLTKKKGQTNKAFSHDFFDYFGLNWKLEDIPGDGNCFFATVWKCLQWTVGETVEGHILNALNTDAAVHGLRCFMDKEGFPLAREYSSRTDGRCEGVEDTHSLLMGVCAEDNTWSTDGTYTDGISASLILCALFQININWTAFESGSRGPHEACDSASPVLRVNIGKYSTQLVAHKYRFDIERWEEDVAKHSLTHQTRTTIWKTLNPFQYVTMETSGDPFSLPYAKDSRAIGISFHLFYFGSSRALHFEPLLSVSNLQHSGDAETSRHFLGFINEISKSFVPPASMTEPWQASGATERKKGKRSSPNVQAAQVASPKFSLFTRKSVMSAVTDATSK